MFKAAPNPPVQLPGATQAAADLSCSCNKSLRPWQCPFKDVQGCPGSVLLRTFKAAVCQPAKLAKPSPAAPRRHSGRGRPFLQLQQVSEAVAVSFKDVQSCSKPSPAAPRRHSGRGRPFLQLQQVPEALAVSF